MQYPKIDLVMSLLDHLEAMVAYWDENEVCQFANNAYLYWFGKTREQMAGITLRQLLGPELYEMNSPYRIAAYAGQVQVFERTLTTQQGNIRHTLATYTPHIVDGKVRGIFVHVADVTPLKQLETELRQAKENAERLATHDFLTGLPNRVLLNDRIRQALALAKRTQNLIAGATLDLDGFKQINDSLGHAAGDKLLIEVAGRIRHALRDVDTATRLGGDEFFLLLPDIETQAQLEGLATRILDAVRAPVDLCGTTLRPSCSLGVAIASDRHIAPEALIEASDKALYAAKALGKNCFSISYLPPAA
ncbi:GGDEF domain-containing protein [Nevskia soli]|uniref:GGDEF domain-containing protein n=1 Tax=Nevskia soli TaxID=418856 RepID=UPI0004A776BB|nr:GGDEF domain-containing protein [Nevskia soli]